MQDNDALPDSPFSSDIRHIYIVDAGPTKIGKIIFNEGGVVGFVEFLVRIQGYARASALSGRDRAKERRLVSQQTRQNIESLT